MSKQSRKIIHFTRLILILIVPTFFFSCGRFDFSHQPQGIIEYEVEYLSNRSSMPTNLLPKKIILKFRSNKSITTIEGFMGMFSLSNIYDFRKHSNITLLKIMDNKYYCIAEKNEAPFFFDSLTNISIQFTSDTAILAGLPCQKAIVTYKADSLRSFDVYYTKAIELEEPNKSTPFYEIDGILMAFNIRLNNIEMRVKATKYKKTNIELSVFEVPDNYKRISRKKMGSVINKLLE